MVILFFFVFTAERFSWNCGAFRDIFLFELNFLLIMPLKSGCFASLRVFSPGIVVLSGTFSFLNWTFSWFCRWNQDVLLHSECFFLELWCFPGHFSFWAELSPDYAAEIRMFCCFTIVSPGIVALSGTFSFSRWISPDFATKTRIFATLSVELFVCNFVLFKNVHVMSIKPYHRAQKPKVISLAEYTRIVAIFIMIAVVVLIALL